jgi:hypothetical protein
MLQKHIVQPYLWHVLNILQKAPAFKDYVLFGGTALHLQIGYRMSDDIDLLTNKQIDKDGIYQFFYNNFQNINIVNSGNAIYQINTNGLKVDFVSLPFKLLEPIQEIDGIRMLSKKDIAVMKLHALANRGDQAKDFVDLYYLLKEYTLKDLLDGYKEKYKVQDISIILKSMIYFDDVKTDNWQGVKMINESLSVSNIKQTLEHEVKEYTKETYEQRY